MLVNWWLIIVLVVIVIIIFGGAFYMVYVFSSPEDRHGAWLPKIVVVLSFALACCTVLLLPFDVANRANPLALGSAGGGMNTVVMWYICLFTIVIMCVVVVPFFIFYYENYDPDQSSVISQILPAIGFTFLTLVGFIILLVVLWFTVGETDILYTAHTAQLEYEDGDGGITYAYNETRPTCMTETNAHLVMKVSVLVYAIALVGVAGWVLFIMFGGVGMAALPVDLIMEWWYRPRPLNVMQYTDRKQKVGARAQLLILKGEVLEEDQRKAGSKMGVKLRKRINEFKAQVMQLEEIYKKLEIAHKDQGGSPWIHWGKLFLGLIAIMLSIVWVAHILAYNIMGVSPFLNTVFIKLDNCFALFGVLAYGICTFYLLWVTIKGVIKVGLRLLFFEVHPMKVGETLMNSFLFNCILILITSVTITQFAALSFRAYAAKTAVDSLFSTYISNLKGIGYVFRYFQYVLIAVTFLSIIVGGVLCNRRRIKKTDDDFRL